MIKLNYYQKKKKKPTGWLQSTWLIAAEGNVINRLQIRDRCLIGHVIGFSLCSPIHSSHTKPDSIIVGEVQANEQLIHRTNYSYLASNILNGSSALMYQFFWVTIFDLSLGLYLNLGWLGHVQKWYSATEILLLRVH